MTRSRRRNALRAGLLLSALVLIPIEMPGGDAQALQLRDACADGSCADCIPELSRTCITPDGNCVDHRNI